MIENNNKLKGDGKGKEKGKEKDEKKENNYLSSIKCVKYSFFITYVVLITTTTITFIEAIKTSNPIVRHILNLETCISIVAGYFYSIFVKKIDDAIDENKPIDWTNITQTRYLDWSITTPMMILALCLVLSQHINKHVEFKSFFLIIILNYLMLYIGYLGENNVINHLTSMIVGFIPFFAMFYIIFINYVKPKYVFMNYLLYFVYLIVWSMYGIVYLLDEDNKNIAFNILDLIAKGIIGLGLWIYYTRIIVF